MIKENSNLRIHQPPRLKLSDIVIGVFILLSFLIGCYIGSSCSYQWNVAPLKSQAIEKGYAEWQVIDTMNGQTEFVWKTPEKNLEKVVTTNFISQ